MEAKNIPQVCGIYAIVNIVNNKRYIGSTIAAKKRCYSHRLALRKNSHHSRHLQNAWNKYGEGAFIFVVLEVCDERELLKREQFYIDTIADYNSSPTAGNCLGFKQSEETKSRQSARMQKIMATNPSFVEHITTLSKGRPKSDQWKLKMSKRLDGKKKPESQIMNMAVSRAALSDSQVIKICNLRLQGIGLKEIAEETGVSWSQVQRIVSGERYIHVQGRPPLEALQSICKRKPTDIGSNVFHFSHKDYGDRVCTKRELLEEFKTLKIAWVTEVCAGRKRSTQGWTVKL